MIRENDLLIYLRALSQERMKLIGGLNEVLKGKEQEEKYMRKMLSSYYFGEIHCESKDFDKKEKSRLERAVNKYVKIKRKMVKKQYHKKLSKDEISEIKNQMIHLSEQMSGLERKRVMRYKTAEEYDDERFADMSYEDYCYAKYINFL